MESMTNPPRASPLHSTHEEKLCQGEPKPGQQRILLKGDALYKVRAAAPIPPYLGLYN